MANRKMNIEKFIAALKELFYEFLGFLLPGLTLFYSFKLFIKTENKINEWVYILSDDFTVLGFAYILGYVIYGIAIFRDNIKNRFAKTRLGEKLKITSTSSILEEIKNSFEYKIAEETVSYLIEKKNINKYNEEIKKEFCVNNLRNFAMSYIPGADKKIYTFMFRAELCNHLNLVTYIIFIVGIFSIILNSFNINFLFKTSTKHFFIYFSFLISGIFLNKTRLRFYKIAMTIPFSIFLAKFYGESVD